MKRTLEFVIDLKNVRTEKEVFDKFNEVLKFVPEKEYREKWNMSWDGLDDFLSGFMYGPEAFVSNLPDRETDAVHIIIINAGHLSEVSADRIKNKNSSIYQAILDSVDRIKKAQKMAVEDDESVIFRNSVLEIKD